MGKGIRVLLFLFLAASLLIGGCGKKGAEPNRGTVPGGAGVEGATQAAAAGGIEVRVTWLTPEYFKATGEQAPAGSENDWLFEIAMTTHAGDLASFDMVKAAKLRVDGRELAATGWQLVENDAHHPVGILRFPRSGNARPGRVELVIANLGGVPERVFAWEE